MTTTRRTKAQGVVARRLFVVALVVMSTIGWSSPPAAAGIVRTTFTITIPSAPTDWSKSVTVPGFVPSAPNSTLVAVEVTVTGQVGGLAAVENVDATPVTVQASLRARIAVQRAGAELVATVPATTRSDDLLAFDGVVDDSGESGRTWTDMIGSAVGTAVLTDAASLAGFTSSSPVALAVDAIGDPAVVTGTGPVQVDAQQVDAGAVIDITYVEATDTTAPPAPTITAPASPSNSLHPSWTFVAEAGAAASCRLVGPVDEVMPWSACTSPFVADLVGQADGRYVLSVRATDAAGNTGEAATSGYDFDHTPPAAPAFTSEPPSPSDDPTPTWTFTAEADASTECAVDGGSFAPCANPASADLVAALDGSHTFAVRATDKAGNVGAAAVSTYLLDRLAPSAPAIVEPPSPSNDPTPTWTVTTELGAHTECAIDGGSFTACAGTFTADLTAATDGTHTMTARATDAAGNVGPTSSASYVLDRGAPDRPVITAPVSPGKSRAPVWTIAAEPGASLECSLDNRPWVWCGATFTADLTDATDGAYTLRVHAVDAAGNIGAAAASTYILDTTAPAAPVITGHPANPSADDEPTWTFSIEPGATAKCSVDGAAWAPCAGSFTADLTSAPDGPHTFSVRATDAAYNTGVAATAAYALDRTAPPAPSIVDSPASPGNDPTPTWRFSMPIDDTAECSVDGGPFLACGTTFTPDLTSAADGIHSVAIRAIDAAGNRSEPASGAYELDRVAPLAPVFTLQPLPLSNERFPAWSFTAEAGAVTMCSLDGAAATPCAVTYTADLADAIDGPYLFSVYAVDDAGNIGPAAASTYTLDASGPGAPTITSGPSGRSRDADVTWTFTVESGAVTECSLDQQAWTPCTDSFHADLASSPDGAHSLAVRATDAAGNVGPSATAAYVLDRLAPLAPTFTTKPPSPSNDRSPAWRFIAETDATTECSLDGGAWAPCSGSYEPSLVGAGDGAHTIAVRATDVAGNVGPSAVVAYVLDTTPPPAPGVVVPPSPSNVAVVTWTLQAPAGAWLQCSVDGGAFTSCEGSVTRNLTGADGLHSVAARAVDDAGNVSEPATATYLFDSIAPDAPVIDGSPADGSLSPRWRFHSEPGTWTECSVDDAEFEPCSGSVRVASDVSSTIAIRAVDDAGNRSVATVASYVPKKTTVGGVAAPGDDPPLDRTKQGPVVAPIAPPAAPDAIDIGPTKEAPARSKAPSVPFAELLPDAVRAIQTAAEHGSIPVALVVIVALFLALQDRIDRRDPKLALAPLRDEPEYVEFTDTIGAET